jgi:entericidin B
LRSEQARLVIGLAHPTPVFARDANRRSGQHLQQNRLKLICSAPDLHEGKIMIRLIAWILIAGSAVLAGCNTMAGAGQDISKGGQAIKNEAQEAK